MHDMKLLQRWFLIVATCAAINAAPFHSALAAVAPSLGTADDFAVLGAAEVTNTGPTIITGGDLGVSPGTAVTGFPPGLVVGGTIHAAGAVAGGAQNDNTTAYNDLAGQACDFELTGQDLGGKTLIPGTYCFTSSAQLTGALTLDAGGNPDAVWVFQIASTLTTASNASVLLVNGGQPCNVFWQIGSSATLGTDTSFIGNILALTSITLTTRTALIGKALAQTGAVTMDSNTIGSANCSVPPNTPVPPTLGKAFSPATVGEGATSTLTITLSNPDATAATLSAALTDTLPTGLLIATTPNASTTCTGGTVTAVAGGSTVSLSAGSSIPANSSCTVTVDVTAASGGSYINVLPAGALQTDNGDNTAPAIATLTVPDDTAPTVGKAFSPATIGAGVTTTLTITLSNADATVATLSAALTDTLPAGLLISTTPNASTTCTGGTVTAVAGSSTVSLSAGATIQANSSCTVTVDVTAATAGSYVNSIAAGALQTNHGDNDAPAIATVTVTVIPPADVPPTVSKSFGPGTINPGGVSILTIVLHNPNPTVATLTAPLIDTLPAGVVVAGSPNASTTCTGGTVSAVAGSSTVSLSAGASIPANGSCTVKVRVKAATKGTYINTLPAGALQTDLGVNVVPGAGTLIVIPNGKPPTLLKKFSNTSIRAGVVTRLIITLRNPNSTAITLTAPLIDNLPNCMVVVGGASTTCAGGTVTAVAGSSTVTLTGGTIPANGACRVTARVTAHVIATLREHSANCVNVLPAGALQTTKGSNLKPATATLTIRIPDSG